MNIYKGSEIVKWGEFQIIKEGDDAIVPAEYVDLFVSEFYGKQLVQCFFDGLRHVRVYRSQISPVYLIVGMDEGLYYNMYRFFNVFRENEDVKALLDNTPEQ